ncbi:MAG: hypothetical protein ACRCRZ_00750, partial [Metamycoplasmataceae bacterium]
MINFKNLILLKATPFLFLPIFGWIIISCSSNQFNNYAKTDISKISEYRKYDEKISEALYKNEIIKNKSMLIVTGAPINDNSFNQSIWEAVSKIGMQTQNYDNNYYESIQPDNLKKAYDAALIGNYNSWILSGFQQLTKIENWLSINNNWKKIMDNKITIIAVDWKVDLSLDSSTPYLKKIYENGN